MEGNAGNFERECRMEMRVEGIQDENEGWKGMQETLKENVGWK